MSEGASGYPLNRQGYQGNPCHQEVLFMLIQMVEFPEEFESTIRIVVS